MIDHLIAASLVEGRGCEKFQLLAEALKEREPKLAGMYAELVESEGGHYSHFWLMACQINAAQALGCFLNLMRN